MNVNLTKGQAVNLSKDSGAKNFEVQASWDISLAGECDIDIMAIMADGNKKAKSFVYFGKMESEDGAVRLSGDNRTGEGDGPDEIIYVDFTKASADVKTIPVLVSIYNGASNFGLVKNLRIDIIDKNTGENLASFVPELEASLSTAMLLGEFVENNGSVFFRAIGTGYNGAKEILAEYGINA